METSVPAVTIERAAELSGSSKGNIKRAKAIVQGGIMSSAVFTLPQIKKLSTGTLRAAMAEILTPLLRCMFQSDQAALQAWHEQQHQDDDEPEIAPPVDPLDPATVVAMIQLICVPDSKQNIIWKTALRRLAVIAGLVMPDLGKLTFDRIASDLTKAGIPTCRATLSNISVHLTDACGLSRSDKGNDAREAYRRRACEVWGKRAERNRKTVRHESKIVDNQ